MNTAVIVTTILIILARVTDVSLDTIRTVAIVQGRKIFAGLLGFFQALIFILAVAKVLANTDHPVYGLAYAIGFGLGTFLGIVIEQRLAFGDQLATIVTRKGVEMAKHLADAGYRLARVQSQVHVGEAAILYVEVPRKRARALIREAVTIDKTCVAILHDVRVAQFAGRNSNN